MSDGSEPCSEASRQYSRHSEKQVPRPGGRGGLLFLSRIRKEAGEAVLAEQGRGWREIGSEWEAGLDLVASCIHYVKEGEEYHTKL